MELLNVTWAWLSDPAEWSGAGSIPQRLVEHLAVTLVVVTIAAAIAIPLGVLIGHYRVGGNLVSAIVGAGRAIPTLGLLTLLGLWIGIGVTAPMIALIVLAAPPLLAGAYSGVTSVEAITVKAARAIGMSEFQIIRSVELPLASPLIIGGIRSAVVQVVATATLAAYTADVGFGRYIFSGLKTRDYGEMIGGALLVIALALLLETVFSFILHTRKLLKGQS
ncbi:Choline transport system permease protein OpuBB [Corynebacterium faecale]|uniref:ABC transporter permease n=1 Tax=Corynebacterium faecale TaxID=1758466 RepID=UPI0025B32D66|nr:ABC transporter permease subunit [Corynebacterium faecale]WJY91019.1 Choline transport system permease protein OpuBB [Corynebacterium faecale]